MGREAYPWLVVGSLIVSGGATAVGVYAFRGRLLPVIVGFILFVVGYRTMQFGVHGRGDGLSLRAIRVNDWQTFVKTVAGLSASVCLSAYGFVVSARAAETLDLFDMTLAGVSIVLGYVVGHTVANDEYL